ncbi:hypothetical protein HC371_24125, partial [Escherichia coli]|nr:hypothetical protein [Escherichia coli]
SEVSISPLFRWPNSVNHFKYMKEKDVASMSGRLLNRWGKIKKPQLLARIERLEQHGQTVIPGLTN